MTSEWNKFNVKLGLILIALYFVITGIRSCAASAVADRVYPSNPRHDGARIWTAIGSTTTVIGGSVPTQSVGERNPGFCGCTAPGTAYPCLGATNLWTRDSLPAGQDNIQQRQLVGRPFGLGVSYDYAGKEGPMQVQGLGLDLRVFYAGDFGLNTGVNFFGRGLEPSISIGYNLRKTRLLSNMDIIVGQTTEHLFIGIRTELGKWN